MAAQWVPEPPAPGNVVQSIVLRAQTPAPENHAWHGVAAEQATAQDSAPALPACHPAAGDDCTPHAHSPVCSACDICHSALLAPPALTAPPAHIAGLLRPRGTAPFASAQAAPAFKPPIL